MGAFWWENFFGEANLVNENVVLVKSLWWENSIWWKQKSGEVSQILVELRQSQDPSVLGIRVKSPVGSASSRRIGPSTRKFYFTEVMGSPFILLHS